MPVLRPGGRHSRARLLDSGRRDAAASGGRGCRSFQGLSVQARHCHPRSLCEQRPNAVAAGSGRRGKSAAGRPDRLLLAGRRRRREVGNPQPAGHGDSQLFQQGSGAQSRPGYRSGCLQQNLPGDAHRGRLRSSALLARAAAGFGKQRRHAPFQLGHALRSASRRRRWGTRRRRRQWSGAAPHVPRRQLALGSPGRVCGAFDRGWPEPDSAHRHQDGSAGEGHARSAADLHPDRADGSQGPERCRRSQRSARAGCQGQGAAAIGGQ